MLSCTDTVHGSMQLPLPGDGSHFLTQAKPNCTGGICRRDETIRSSPCRRVQNNLRSHTHSCRADSNVADLCAFSYSIPQIMVTATRLVMVTIIYNSLMGAPSYSSMMTLSSKAPNAVRRTRAKATTGLASAALLCCLTDMHPNIWIVISGVMATIATTPKASAASRTGTLC